MGDSDSKAPILPQRGSKLPGLTGHVGWEPSPGGQLPSRAQDRDTHTQQSSGCPGSKLDTGVGVVTGQTAAEHVGPHTCGVSHLQAGTRMWK